MFCGELDEWICSINERGGARVHWSRDFEGNDWEGDERGLLGSCLGSDFGLYY